MLKEAASYPRMEALWKILTYISKSQHPIRTFHEYFLQIGSDEYTCPDGQSVGKDFGIFNRGSCNGFRYDGSATFSDYSRISNINTIIISDLSSSSQYSRALGTTKGKINPQLFAKLAALNKTIVKNGGFIMLYMPPLAPGVEKAFLSHPPLSHELEQTKADISAWAKGRPILLADFGQSEKYGCLPDEFLDSHHAAGSCYKKIFTNFWNDKIISKKISEILATNKLH